MTALFAPVCSITTTRRRRFLWAAWWSKPPEKAPFRKPDAYEGGARTVDEARAKAERAAGQPLVEIDSGWARAWGRILVGEPAWPKTTSERASTHEASTRGESPEDRSSKDDAVKNSARSIWMILGVERTATLVEIKRAYRKRALETHPDHGGTRESFQEVLRAFELATRRKKKPAPKSRG